MTTFTSNIDGNSLTSESGHLRFMLETLSGNILQGFQVLSSINSNEVIITKGDLRIDVNDYWYTVFNDEDMTFGINAPNLTLDRVDRLVVYVDRQIENNPTDINFAGTPKLMVVSGIATSNPLPPNDSVVDNAVGRGNPWIEIAKLTIKAGISVINQNNIQNTHNPIKNNLVQRIVYPVNSIYVNSADSRNPNEILGFGEWELFSRGRFLGGYDENTSGFDEAGLTTGSRTVTLNTNQIPSHNHTGTTDMGGNHAHIAYSTPNLTEERIYGTIDSYITFSRGGGTRLTNPAGNHNHVLTTDLTGQNFGHNNVQSALVVAIWRRIA